MKRTLLLAGCLLLCAGCAKKAAPRVVSTFHNCEMVGGSSNNPRFQDMSETYSCDEGLIELKGHWSMTIEYGYVYGTEMGRPSIEQPYRAAKRDYDYYIWCPTPKPWDAAQKELCGLKEKP